MAKRNSLMNFGFCKRPKPADSHDEDEQHVEPASVESLANAGSTADAGSIAESCSTSAKESTAPVPMVVPPRASLSVTCPPVDVGLIIKKFKETGKLNDNKITQCLNNRWVPSKRNEMPWSMKGQEKRYLGEHRLRAYPWLAVSQLEGMAGAWCVWCALFCVSGTGGVGYQRLGELVNKPLNNFSRLTGLKKGSGILTDHCTCEYHLSSAEQARSHSEVTDDSSKDVRNLLDLSRQKSVEQSRRKLHSIVDTIVTLARQNLPLRGHRDSGPVPMEQPAYNDGNFREFLRFRVRAGDTVLQNHLLSGAGNAQYTSPEVQNSILDTAFNLVQEKILSNVRETPCWSLLCDETSDRAKRELIVFVARYVHFNKGKATLREDPIALLDILKELSSLLGGQATEQEVRLSGVNIAEVMKKKCQDMSLRFDSCVGQGLDGAANMSSVNVGAAVEFQKEAP